MINPEDIPGIDRPTALRLLAKARSIAPCLDNLEGTDRETAIAILQGVASELPKPGARRIRTQSRNGTSVGYDGFASAFSDDDKDSLRALCGASSASAAAAPVGSFPDSGLVKDLWPEKQTRP